MKCISLWQPWATLWLIGGVKEFETRGWATNHRGPIAVHAAKSWTYDRMRLCMEPRFRVALENAGYFVQGRQPLPLGAILGVIDLTGCHRIAYGGIIMPAKDTDEYHFGDWTPGRFAWRGANPRRLAEPVPYRGQQGIFEVDDALVAEALSC